MKSKTPVQETVEVIEQLEEAQIDLEVVRWFAQEGTAPDSGRRRLERRRCERGDGLTGMYDHDTLITPLVKEIERARRHAESVAVLMLDLDDFKQVNEELGHQKRDEVLARTSEILRETVRSMDIPGRYGGEEFAVILPEADTGSALRSAERLRRAVAAVFERDTGLSVSVGAACFPEHAGTVETFIRMADEALYQAKREGKNRVVCANT